MMNQRLLFTLLLAAGLAMPASAACSRQSKCASKSTTCSSAKSTTSIPQAFSSLSFVQGNPDKNAKYYIYLHSASWCKACAKAMPAIVKSYKEVKKAGMEIILIGHEKSAEQVKKHLDSFNATFPALLDTTCLSSKLPGYKSSSCVPHVFVLSRNGKELFSDHPNTLFTNSAWKKYLKKWESSCGKTGSCGTTGSDDTTGSDTIKSVSDMNQMLTDMAAQLEKSRSFECEKNVPKLVNQTLAEKDCLSGYGIAYCDNTYTLVPGYLDVTRMLYEVNNGSTGCSNGSTGCNNESSGCDSDATERANTASDEEQKALKILKERLKEIITEDMTPQQKVLAIHDDLVNRVSYSFKGDCYTATGMILNDTGVCNAYALYMYLALKLSDIPCHRVVGNNGFNHAWNLVNLDGEWYHLDATWDDPICSSGQSILRHTYFCVSDETIAKDHKWDRSIYPASAKEDLLLSECGSYSSQDDCMSALREASGSGCTSIEGRAAYGTDQAAFAKSLASLTTSSGEKIGITSYYLDKSTGHFIVNFGSTDGSQAPQALELEKNPVESAESTGKWLDVKSDELNKAAEKALQKYLSPESGDSWEDLLKKSQDVLNPS